MSFGPYLGWACMHRKKRAAALTLSRSSVSGRGGYDAVFDVAHHAVQHAALVVGRPTVAYNLLYHVVGNSPLFYCVLRTENIFVWLLLCRL